MKRTRIRPISKKRATVMADLPAAVEAAKMRDGHQCQAIARMPAIECAGPLVGHHLILRSAWRAGVCVVENIVTLCERHHGEVHANPQESRRLGLLLHSWDRPS